MPIFSIKTPDGRTLDIEAGSQEAAVAGAQDWVSKNPLKKAEGPGVSGYLDYLGNELTLGGLDRAQAAVRAITGGKSYSQAFAEEKAGSEADAAKMGTATKLGMSGAAAVPWFLLGGPIGGSIRGAAGVALKAPGVGSALANLSRASQVAKATMPPKLAEAASALVPAQGGVVRGAASTATAGAGLGGVEAALRGNDISSGALTGAALGGALGAAGTGISKALTKPKTTPAPTVDDLFTEADALFNKARGGFTYITPEASDRIRDKMRQSVRTFSSNSRLMPNTQDILNNQLGARGTGMTLDQLDDLRQILQREAKVQKSGMYDRDSAGLISMNAALRDELSSLKPKDITGAFGPSANKLEKVQNLQEGIKTWGRAEKAATMSGIMKDAGVTAGKYTQSGQENAIRTKFRQLAENKRQMNYYTPEEQEMIRKIAAGSVSKNILRRLGKFAPDDLFKSIPYMFTGPAGIPLAAGAHAAKLAANRMARKEAQNLLDYVARGGFGQQLQASPRRKKLAKASEDAARLFTYGLLGQ